MASRYCTYCGTSNPANAAFCMSCGAPMQGAPSSAPGTGPLPGTGGPAPPAAPYGGAPSGYYPPPPPPPRRRHRWLLIIAVVVVAILLIGGLAVFFLVPTSNVEVTVINYVSPDNSCGWAGATDYGFNVTPGSSYSIAYNVTGNTTASGGTGACLIHSVTTSTSGFSITGANVPLVVPANATEIFVFTINTPSSSFTGPLTIEII